MATRQYNRLTALQVKRLKEPGRYTDGDGLALVIMPDGASFGSFVIQLMGGVGTWALVRRGSSHWPKHGLRSSVTEE
ncbi:MAG: hypothetical protein AAFX98_05630 [Pseudomonadota bacterium]